SHHPANPEPGPWRGFAELQLLHQLTGPDCLPALHPDEEEAQDYRPFQQTLAGRGIAAHVAPEIKQPQQKGQSSQIIGSPSAEGRPAQEGDGLLGQLQCFRLGEAAPPGFHGFSCPEASHTVPSLKAVGTSTSPGPNTKKNIHAVNNTVTTCTNLTMPCC